jgi:catechol 2,3-dioxygenase-like lactoylglutathione lyase family enzyme
VGEGRITALDHVQLVIPAGDEQLAAARSFYAELLGLREIEKPEVLRARGGIWFEGPGFQLHLGVEEPSETRRHPAFATDDLGALRDRCRTAGVRIVEDAGWPGVARFYVFDPFGNRIEMLHRSA